MGPVVLDTTVLIGLFDPKDAHHMTSTAKVRRLRDRGSRFIIPVVVLSEALVGSARQHHGVVEQRRKQVRDAFGNTREVDETIAVEAAFLRGRHRSLRLPDALVIATGIVDDAEQILTADKRWEGIDDRIRVLGEQ